MTLTNNTQTNMTYYTKNGTISTLRNGKTILVCIEFADGTTDIAEFAGMYSFRAFLKSMRLGN